MIVDNPPRMRNWSSICTQESCIQLAALISPQYTCSIFPHSQVPSSTVTLLPQHGTCHCFLTTVRPDTATLMLRLRPSHCKLSSYTAERDTRTPTWSSDSDIHQYQYRSACNSSDKFQVEVDFQGWKCQIKLPTSSAREPSPCHAKLRPLLKVIW